MVDIHQQTTNDDSDQIFLMTNIEPIQAIIIF